MIIHSTIDIDINMDIECHSHKEEAIYASVGYALLWGEHSVKLLGLFIDSKLTFDIHVQTICKKASQKLTAIIRLANTTSQEKRIVTIKTFFESQFSYCSLL